jgi:adenylate cyclase
MNRDKHSELNEDPAQGLLPQHVKRALVYMRVNIAAKISLTELASACALPERTLLKQFRRFVGLSPLMYLRRLRLNLVRGELLQASCEETISEIATNHGLAHLGRFAAEYRRAFGESPSATRSRARELRLGRAVLSAPGVTCEKPLLLLAPFRTETVEEELEARDLLERLCATLSRVQLANVTMLHRAPDLLPGGRRQRDTGLQYALMGRVRRVDASTRIIARLIAVDTNLHLWGNSFDGLANDPLSLQDRVVDGVLRGVVSTVTDAELGRVRDKDIGDRSARELATQALPLIFATAVTSTKNAMALLTRAAELSPCDPLPLALLACCHVQLALYLGTSIPASARREAERFARDAALLETNDPLVMTARSMAISMAGQCQEGHPLLARALAMDPSSTWAWERSGFSRLSRGDPPDHAIADFTRALQLRGPGWPGVICFTGIASAHRVAGRAQEAELWAQRALAERPDEAWMHRWQSRHAFELGDRKRMARAAEQLRRSHPGVSVSLLAAADPWADPRWLDALGGAGIPP